MCWGFGDIGAVLISYWPLLHPHPHYIHYTVPDVFRKISQWVSWAVITKTKKKKSIKCAYLAKGFSSELYLQLCICLTEGSLCDFRVWKGVNFWCLPSAGTDSQSVRWFFFYFFDPLPLYIFWGEHRQLTLNQHATRLQYIARGKGTLKLCT